MHLIKTRAAAGAATSIHLDIPQVQTSHFGEFSIRFRNGYPKIRYKPDKRMAERS